MFYLPLIGQSTQSHLKSSLTSIHFNGDWMAHKHHHLSKGMVGVIVAGSYVKYLTCHKGFPSISSTVNTEKYYNNFHPGFIFSRDIRLNWPQIHSEHITTCQLCPVSIINLRRTKESKWLFHTYWKICTFYNRKAINEKRKKGLLRYS